MDDRLKRLLGLTLLILAPWPRVEASTVPGIRAQLRPVSYQLPTGQPVLVRFMMENTTGEPITLTVPGAEPDIPSPEVGLPISHVFSGGALPSLTVSTESGRRWDDPIGYRPAAQAPILVLGSNSVVGTTLDMRDYFPALRGAGMFRLTWQPYAGAFNTETVVITIAPLKQVELITDEGTMVIRMLYDDAPSYVANFLELTKSGFYNGKTFHSILSGHMILGGCPLGNGQGIRLDGKRLPAEFNSRRHQKGTVSMALIPGEPDSASCQFFICNTDHADWDGVYTVFGHLVGDESFATLDRLMSVPVDDTRPLRPLVIRSARIIDASGDVLNNAP